MDKVKKKEEKRGKVSNRQKFSQVRHSVYGRSRIRDSLKLPFQVRTFVCNNKVIGIQCTVQQIHTA